MTDRVLVTLSDGIQISRKVLNLKQVAELKKQVKVHGDEDLFTYTYISNKEYLVLVKLGMAEELMPGEL